MICKHVPEGQLACSSCVAIHAGLEFETLSARRFLDGEITFRSNDAGHGRKPMTDQTWCGVKFASKGVWMAKRSVKCEACMTLIRAAVDPKHVRRSA